MNSEQESVSAALWREIARRNNGPDYARRYAAHFDALEARGDDVHGEADLVTSLVPSGAAVLDAGCGTGRLAARLADLGYSATGVDVDDAMVAVARDRRPDLDWHVADLVDLDLGRIFDAVVSAGNVIPFIPPAALPRAAAALARHTAPGGVVVCGFGLVAAHLPKGAPEVDLATYDAAFDAAGLKLEARYAGWDRAAYDGGGYVVNVHRR